MVLRVAVKVSCAVCSLVVFLTLSFLEFLLSLLYQWSSHWGFVAASRYLAGTMITLIVMCVGGDGECEVMDWLMPGRSALVGSMGWSCGARLPCIEAVSWGLALVGEVIITVKEVPLLLSVWVCRPDLLVLFAFNGGKHICHYAPFS